MAEKRKSASNETEPDARGDGTRRDSGSLTAEEFVGHVLGLPGQVRARAQGVFATTTGSAIASLVGAGFADLAERPAEIKILVCVTVLLWFGSVGMFAFVLMGTADEIPESGTSHDELPDYLDSYLNSVIEGAQSLEDRLTWAFIGVIAALVSTLITLALLGLTQL